MISAIANISCFFAAECIHNTSFKTERQREDVHLEEASFPEIMKTLNTTNQKSVRGHRHPHSPHQLCDLPKIRRNENRLWSSNRRP